MRRCEKLRLPWLERRRTQLRNEEKPIQTSVTLELDKAIDDAGRAVLDGKLAVGGSLAQPVQQGNGEQPFRILSANISTCGPQAEGFLRILRLDAFRRWHSRSTFWVSTASTH